MKCPAPNQPRRRAKTLFAAACLFLTAIPGPKAWAQAPEMALPLPNGQEFPFTLSLIDESGGRWIFLPVKPEPNETGFVAEAAPSSGPAFPITGIFEKGTGTVNCTVKWSDSAELDQVFMMLTMSLPIDQVHDAELVSNGQRMSISKMVNDEPTRTAFSGATSFTFGPFDGQELLFDFQTPVDVGVVVMGGKDYAHVRLNLSQRGNPFPSSGEVSWTVGLSGP